MTQSDSTKLSPKYEFLNFALEILTEFVLVWGKGVSWSCFFVGSFDLLKIRLKPRKMKREKQRRQITILEKKIKEFGRNKNRCSFNSTRQLVLLLYLYELQIFSITKGLFFQLQSNLGIWKITNQAHCISEKWASSLCTNIYNAQL